MELTGVFGMAEARRMPALTVSEMDADASIRVVPPSFRSLLGMEITVVFLV